MKRTALLSVSDRTGLEAFARGLVARNFDLLTTSGTGKFLKEKGISSMSIEDYTGQAEIFGGRVKTLHPKIYAGILARRSVNEDLKLLEQDGIRPIEVVAVNLYPFKRSLEDASAELVDHEMIELIDIGGPSMIRAAAKNHDSVLPLIDPADYEQALRVIDGVSATEEQAARRALAAKVFALLADDGVAIASYLSGGVGLNVARQPAKQSSDVRPEAMVWNGIVGQRSRTLRYGENPHQTGEFFVPIGSGEEADRSPWHVHGGKVLSYNNLLDCDSVVRLLHILKGGMPTAVIIKHLNPCGAARGPSVLEALQMAKRSDPRSHFGGIIGSTSAVTRAAAEEIREDFAEVVVAPSYEPEALQILLHNKNLRVVEVDLARLSPAREVRTVLDGFLVQSPDTAISPPLQWEPVAVGQEIGHGSGRMDDLHLAWQLCSQVKSNAIVIVKDGMLVGVGAGQMSRVDSVEVALHKARLHKHDLRGAVAASDAFFPFPDGLELLLLAGVSHVVAPRGAKRDADVVAMAQKHNVSLYFAPDRHFRH